MTQEASEELRQRLLNDEEVREMIAQRAYELYEQRGGEPGHGVEDWLLAESMVLASLLAEESLVAAETAGAERSQQPLAASAVPEAVTQDTETSGQSDAAPQRHKKATG